MAHIIYHGGSSEKCRFENLKKIRTFVRLIRLKYTRTSRENAFQLDRDSAKKLF